MSIEVPSAEVYALADVLVSAGEETGAVPATLGDGAVGGDLQPGVVGFCVAVAAAAVFLAAELDTLGTAVASVADSWLQLDGSLLATPGRVVAQ